MQIITKEFDCAASDTALRDVAPLDDVIYVDIETTGLSAERDVIYLIGVAAHSETGWKLTQWFDDDGNGEKDILTSFLIFARSFHVLLHYNGDRFDLPFLKKRIEVNSLAFLTADHPFPEGLRSIDLFREIQPWKQLLALSDYRQQTVEAFFGTGRKEEASGGELIRVYRSYLAAPSKEQAQQLLDHNAADVEGLVSITPILGLRDLFAAGLAVTKAQADSYRNAEGKLRTEIVLFCTLRGGVPAFRKDIGIMRDGCAMNLSGSRVVLKVPMITGELKYFYANYRNYYYLPGEDTAMHKSIASFVDPSRRRQATAETCYTRKKGSYLPEWDRFREPFYKQEYREKIAWFEFRPEQKRDRAFFNEYANYVFRHLVDPGG